MIKIANHINELDFNDQHLAIAYADGKKICIAKFNDQLFAVAYKCPHAGGIMAAGHIDAHGNIVCPLHRYKYCLSNGRNVSGEGYYLKHWPVKITDDGVFVEMRSGWKLF